MQSGEVTAAAYKIPTDFPEADGTFDWDETTIVIVEISKNGAIGLGFTYTHSSAAYLIRDLLGPLIIEMQFDVSSSWKAMVRALRNMGRPGIGSCAIAAVDCALWDLEAKLKGVPLVRLLGQRREAVPVYGSGGFTSYPLERLEAQLSDWVEEGFTRVKMKVGRNASEDIARVRMARAAIGESTELYVDANGAYGVKESISQAQRFAEFGVSWFEEPVSSDDLEGLARIRSRSPDGMDIAAGEYGYDTGYFRRMIESGAVDVIQPDGTRCAGISGFLEAAALGEAVDFPMSAHTAPSFHLHLCCASKTVRHAEYFHDHVRIEQLFFDGAARAENGELRPDLTRPGLGLEFKRVDAEPFLVG